MTNPQSFEDFIRENRAFETRKEASMLLKSLGSATVGYFETGDEEFFDKLVEKTLTDDPEAIITLLDDYRLLITE